jgi:type III secretion protein J
MRRKFSTNKGDARRILEIAMNPLTVIRNRRVVAPKATRPTGRALGSARWMIVLGLALLCSCKSQLYSRVSERDANEILATLYAAGVHAEKTTSDEKSWSVEVDEQDLQRALQVAAEHGLPREQFVNTGDLFKKEGLISTPSEERIRYIYAVSQELSNTLSQIDGVISARVHPVIPANDPLGSQIRPSSASVFIKYRHDANLEAMAPAIKNLVMHSIEGLGYENISVTFVVAEDSAPSRNVPLRSTSYRPIGATVGALGTLLLLLFFGFGCLFSRNRSDVVAKEAMRAMSGSAAGPRRPQTDNIRDFPKERQDDVVGRSRRGERASDGPIKWWEPLKQWISFGKGDAS